MLTLSACLLLSLSVAAVAHCCEEYGVGEVSRCTHGFPTLFHIDKVAGNVDLDTPDKRQVLIPDINFSCNGSITRVIVGARWEGNTGAYTELQLWRRISEGQYMKVNGSSIMVSGENTSQVYELETSIAFQEGDILGYFQPVYSASEIDLYLEDSGRLITYYTSASITSPAPGDVFSIDSASEDTRYPLIAVKTDPPDCGCGFISVQRVYAHLSMPPLQTIKSKWFNDQQLIFPNITFTCSGELVKWTIGGRWNSYDNQFPELQIWRNSGNDTYEKQSGTVISVTEKEDDDVYEYPVAPPLPFQPGDILGILQPHRSDSRLRVYYDENGDSVNYGTRASVSNELFIIGDSSITTSTNIPLVTVEIVEYTPSITCCESTLLFTSTQTSSHHRSSHFTMSTNTQSLLAPITTTPAGFSFTMTTTTPDATTNSILKEMDSGTSRSTILPNKTVLEQKNSSKSVSRVIGASVGVATAVIVLIAAVLIIITVTVCLRQRRKLLITSNVANGQLSMSKDTTVEVYDNVPSYGPRPPQPDHAHKTSDGGVISYTNETCGAMLGEGMTENVAYGVGQNELELSANVAYTATASGGGASEGEHEEKYAYITRNDVIVTATHIYQ